jgi:hypothetical protein
LEAASDLAEQTLDALRRAEGNDHPGTLTAINVLAMNHRDLGHLDRARELFEEALAGRRRVLGDDHPDTLRSMNNLAAIRRQA